MTADSLPLLSFAEIAHAMPGRARLRIPGRRGDTAFFASVAAGLATIPGVRKVETTPLTGSILILHTGPFAPISMAAQAARLFGVSKTPPAPPAASTVAIDPKVILGLGLGLAAAWQLAKGHVLPPAITLVWYAGHLSGLWASDVFEDSE